MAYPKRQRNTDLYFNLSIFTHYHYVYYILLPSKTHYTMLQQSLFLHPYISNLQAKLISQLLCHTSFPYMHYALTCPSYRAMSSLAEPLSSARYAQILFHRAQSDMSRRRAQHVSYRISSFHRCSFIVFSQIREAYLPSTEQLQLSQSDTHKIHATQSLFAHLPCSSTRICFAYPPS